MSDLEGTYRIGSDWDLFVDGALKSVYVEEIVVEPAPGGGHDYFVEVYTPAGRSQRLVVTNRVDRDSLASTLRSEGHDVSDGFSLTGGL